MINKIFKISNVIDCVRAIIIGIVLMVATNLVNKLRPTIGEQPAQVLTVALVIIGMVFFLVGVLMLSQITRSRDRSNDPGQFASPNIVSFIQHFPAAVISEGEKIVGWYGSMGRSDARGLGGSVLIKEKVAPENTLLATEKQFIAMQVNREDTAKLQTNGR